MASAAAAEQFTRIQATRGWGSLGLGDLVAYRDLLWSPTLKEIKVKYRQMALGPLWIVLQPVINMLLFTFVFGTIAKLPSEGIPYPIFTFTALLPWILFQNACTFSSTCLVDQMHVISKIYFPRMILPIASTLAWLVDFAISFVVLLVVMACFGFVPGWQVVFLPLFLLLAVVFALAIGFLSASLAVKYRDVKFVVSYGLRAFMFLTPVAYSGTLVDSDWQWLYQLNPMYWVIEGFRWALLGTSAGPDWGMIIPVLATVALFVLGVFVFRRTERNIVDLL